MGKIQILDKHIAELIAAGEVVERPASVVKELLENAVDALSTKVTVEISDGGITFIRISDDGAGMDKEDVPLALTRHGTSKVRSAEDLDRILSLGFRGEALPAIASVSEMEIITKRPKNEFGVHGSFLAGECVSLEDTGAPAGTTVIVRKLFYNTPARMKFLKKDSLEAGQIERVIEYEALSHPEVSFQYIKDGKMQFLTPGNGDLKQTIFSLFGKETADDLLKADYELSPVSVSGFVGKPERARGSKSLQFLFVNGRYVKSRTFDGAIDEAYRDRLMVKRFPLIFLHLRIDPSMIDINVHPSKLEIKFSNEKQVYDAVYFAAKSALNACESRPLADSALSAKPQGFYMPGVEPLEERPMQGGQIKMERESIFPFPKEFETAKAELLEERVSLFKEDAKEIKEDVVHAFEPDTILESYAKEPLKAVQMTRVSEKEEKKDADFKIIGEAFLTYIIIEMGEELYLIDKHALHERYIYERLKGSFDKRPSQVLLEPVAITLSRDEMALCAEYIHVFSGMGFLLESFGDDTMLLREAPSEFLGEDISSIVTEILSEIGKNRRELRTGFMDRLYQSVSCKAAVKAGHKNTREELSFMVEMLFKNADLKCCPHGRPVMITLTKAGIEKQFGRIV